MWDSEMVILLRHVIDDLDEPVKYTDDRLMQLILVAGQYAQSENIFDNEYAISAENLTLKPDPTSIATRDDAFVNLTVLRAACFLASSGLLKVSKQTIFAKEATYQFDGRGKPAARKIAVDTWCEAYKDAQWEHSLRQRDPGRAIIGPYRLAISRMGYNPSCIRETPWR
jgi:hypothetical protein